MFDFILGCFIGGMFGMIITCLFQRSKDDEIIEELRERKEEK